MPSEAAAPPAALASRASAPPPGLKLDHFRTSAGLSVSLPLILLALGAFVVSTLSLVNVPPPYPLFPAVTAVASLALLFGFAGVPTVLGLLHGPDGPAAVSGRAQVRRDAWGAMPGLVATLLLWPAIVALPLYMTVFGGAARHFDEDLWAPGAGKTLWAPLKDCPSPLGLSLGLAAVVVGMVPLVLYHGLRRSGYLGEPTPIQRTGAPSYAFWEGVATHVSQPEGFALLGLYLVGTWMAGWMPASYYEHEGGVNWLHVAAQLLVQDLIQYLGHLAEHRVSHAFYRISHKPHHHHTNPRIFDAFSAAPTDTICMILLPLLLTSRIVHANVWSYMAFGTLYANWLTLIHSEFSHPWDPLFRSLGLGTAADHHVHHKLFKYNFSHLFMYWDRVAGTYRDPALVKSFNAGV